MGLDKFDFAIIALYLAGITLFGLRFRKRQRSLRDYFLADRSIPWWAIALSIVAAETSTLTIISIPGLAYDTNFTFLQVVLGYLAGRVIISFVLLPHYFRGDLYPGRRSRQISRVRFQPEFLEAVHLLGGADRRRFSHDRKSRDGSVDCPEAAGGAQSAAVGRGSAIKRHCNSISVRAVSDRRSHALCVLSRAVRQLREARQNLSAVHRQPHAARHLGIAHRSNSC